MGEVLHGLHAHERILQGVAGGDHTVVGKQDRVMALREIREAHKDMFEKLFDAGVFERKLGTLDAVVRNTPLPEERKQAIRATFQNWGLIEAPKEKIVEIQETSE